jgi:hypothetical protein
MPDEPCVHNNVERFQRFRCMMFPECGMVLYLDVYRKMNKTKSRSKDSAVAIHFIAELLRAFSFVPSTITYICSFALAASFWLAVLLGSEWCLCVLSFVPSPTPSFYSLVDAT